MREASFGYIENAQAAGAPMFESLTPDRHLAEAALWRVRQANGKRPFVVGYTVLLGNSLQAMLMFVWRLFGPGRVFHTGALWVGVSWGLCLALGYYLAHALWQRGIRLTQRYPAEPA